MHPLHDERGFTLIELLVSMVIGLIVIFAAYTILDTSGTISRRTQDRVDAAQRGRLAMDVIGSELRSQVCLPGAIPPMVAGATATDFTFYSNLGDQEFAAAEAPLLRPERRDQGADVAGDLQRIGHHPDRELGRDPHVAHARGARGPGRDRDRDHAVLPLLGLRRQSPRDDQPAARRLAAQRDRRGQGRPGRRQLRTRARPARRRRAGATSIFQQSIYFRTADPMDPGKGPKCQ